MYPPTNNTEGYVKYQYYHTAGSPPELELQDLAELNQVRSRLWQLGYVGADATGVGFGNVSIRVNHRQFIISGTQTGHLTNLQPHHYTLVQQYSITQNKVWGLGQIPASSEALTHAALYQTHENCHTVLHIHHAHLWQKWLYVLPTTQYQIPYGTPQMAIEIQRLYNHTAFAVTKTLVMAGHTHGLLAFGSSPHNALNNLLKWAQL